RSRRLRCRDGARRRHLHRPDAAGPRHRARLRQRHASLAGRAEHRGTAGPRAEARDVRLPLYIVDAFAERPLSGNPAAICLLETWPEDRLMQAIAAEVNLSETAFVVPEGQGWRIRWFTPTLEVDLVGHATLAAAHVLFTRG